VRRIAKRVGLPTAEKKDSQGICFLGAVSMGDFLKQYIPEAIGPIVTPDGTQIGSHTGAFQYTIGQRHLGIPGFRAGAVPHYVARKDVATNTITVAPGGDSSLYTDTVRLTDIRSDYGWEELQNMSLRARIRYRQPLIHAHADRKGAIRFAEAQKFVASGQSVVLYTKPFWGPARIVAGGTIVKTAEN
jgi:tRNA-specific 2-thiouridylase